MTKQPHPQLRFAKMMVARIDMCVDLSDVEWWKENTINAYKDYPHGRKLVQRAIARAEHRINQVARINAASEKVPS